MKNKHIFAILALAVTFAVSGCGALQQTTNQIQESEEKDDSKNKEDSEEKESEEVKNEEASEEESEVSEVPRADWKLIKEYGFENDYSVLSYTLDPSSALDVGDYYTVHATFNKPISVPGNLKLGDTYEITTNELTGEKKVLTYSEEGYLTSDDDSEYYYTPSKDGSDVVLYWFSDDRVDTPFYEGTLYIRKDAVTGAAILQQPYDPVTLDGLKENSSWFNGVAFDKDGYVTQLIFFGD